MTRVNEHNLPEEERVNRKVLREAIISPSGHPDGPDIYLKRAIAFEFKMKKPAYDAQGAIDAFYFEEGMRQQFFYPFLKPGSVVFDVGACHGSYSLPALALGARVFAFEPDPRWQKSLTDCIALNPGFAERFILIGNALSDENYRSASMDELEDVQCMKLDAFVDNMKVYPDYIKIDAEGMEGRVVAGALKTLEHLPHPRLLVEHHPKVAPRSHEWIVQKLQEMGYILHPLRQKTDWVLWSFFDDSYFNP